MPIDLIICTALALMIVLDTVWGVKSAVAATSLKSAWRWLMAGCGAWMAALLASSVWGGDHPALFDHIWYAISVLMLCPPVAVLGARRPLVNVWTLFVLVPLLLVLGLPLLQDLADIRSLTQLDLELPATLGYLLVLIMGAGNYFGTRFTFASFLFATSLVVLLSPVSSAIPDFGFGRDETRFMATLPLAVACLAAKERVKCDHVAPRSLDRLWLDFRDWYGIVWAKRVQDRVNLVAAEEHWRFRLEMHGLVPSPSDEATIAQAARAFRWILRRFVDPEWIDERLPAEAEPADSPPPITGD